MQLSGRGIAEIRNVKKRRIKIDKNQQVLESFSFAAFKIPGVPKDPVPTKVISKSQKSRSEQRRIKAKLFQRVQENKLEKGGGGSPSSTKTKTNNHIGELYLMMSQEEKDRISREFNDKFWGEENPKNLKELIKPTERIVR